MECSPLLQILSVSVHLESHPLFVVIYSTLSINCSQLLLVLRMYFCGCLVAKCLD